MRALLNVLQGIRKKKLTAFGLLITELKTLVIVGAYLLTWLEKRELEASKRYLSWRGNRSALVAPAQAAVLATSTKRARRPSSRERSGVRYAADAPAASDKAEGGGGADDMVVSDATPRADEGPS